MDTVSRKKRSENMRRIRAKGMKPEMTVRKLVFGMGYRYRLHGKGLPGKPDLVFAGRKKIIFVHGCFWHLHPSKRCPNVRIPKSNRKYWVPKLEGNAARDKRNIAALRRAGWGVMIVWECQCGKKERLTRRIEKFLGPPGEM